jgi:mannosyltransferase
MAILYPGRRSVLPAWLYSYNNPNSVFPNVRRTRGRLYFAILFLALALEVMIHVRSFRISPPERDSDQPFQRGCRVPQTDAPRANATLVMLARNEDLDVAMHTVQSIEARFNRFFHYPIVFLNEKPFDDTFIHTMSALASGETTFETLKFDMWNFPKWIDPMEARKSFKAQGEAKILHAELESYHHMCRFFSG